MKAVINNTWVEIPDPQPQPGLVLIRTECSSRLFESAGVKNQAGHFKELVKTRLPKIPQMLKYDGLKMIGQKALHMTRRELQESGGHCASFCGTVIDDQHEGESLNGKRVAGISISHPADTEYVIARREYVFPIADDVDERLAALLLYGGMALHLADTITEPFGIAGEGLLAKLLSAVLHQKDLSDVTYQETWIDTGTTSPDPAWNKKVIGFGVKRKALESAWPGATEHDSMHPGELAMDPDFITDLYYHDGELEVPDWFKPELFQRWLERAPALNFELPEARPLSFFEGDPKETRKQLAEEKARGRELLCTRFDEEGPFAPAVLKLKGPSKPGTKKVSLIGAGRWPLGMVIRQIVRNEKVSVRGVCDRRPEVLHLAAKAFPFEFASTNADDIFNDPETDMVVVAPFHESHAHFAARALEAGKHCYVEKPPAVNREQFEMLRAAAEHSDRMLYVGYNRRFAPAITILCDELKKVEGPASIGMVIRPADIGGYKRWILWPSNGGSRVVSNICHMADLAMQLAGNAKPIRVQAIPSTVGRPDLNLTVVLNFDDGSIASILFTDKGFARKGGGYDEFYHVMKGDLKARVDNFTHLEINRPGRKPITWRGELDKGHRPQMTKVADALVRDAASPIPLDVTLQSAGIYLGVVASLEAGGEAVTL